MVSTRDFKSLGVMASDALEVTEDGVREQGTAYRKTNLSGVVQIEGEPYDEAPITENINEKLFNQSSFTDVVDKKGVPGWTDLVDYVPPALLFASDGKYYTCLRDSGPSTSAFDPIDDDQDDPVFWELFEGANQLRKDLATSTPGSEGARIVAYNDFDTNGGVDEPTTVKAALDSAFSGLFFNGNLTILATGKLFIDASNTTPFPGIPGVFQTFVDSNFNTTVADPIPIITSTPGLGGQSFIQGFTVSFVDPLPTPYNIEATTFSSDLLPFDIGVESISIRNLIATSFDVYLRSYIGALSKARQRWIFNYIAYTV